MKNNTMVVPTVDGNPVLRDPRSCSEPVSPGESFGFIERIFGTFEQVVFAESQWTLSNSE